MGVDVELQVRFDPDAITSEELDKIARAFKERFPVDYPGYGPSADEWPYLEIQHSVAEVHTLHRFYGPSYARGDWPHIKSMGDWLMSAFGERGQVFYGGDCDDPEWYMSWQTVRTEYQDFWDEYGNEPYDITGS